MTTPAHNVGHVQPQLGVYVLDALAPDERAQVDTHLAGCPECRAEATALRWTREVLDLLTPEDAEIIRAGGATPPAPAGPGPSSRPEPTRPGPTRPDGSRPPAARPASGSRRAVSARVQRRRKIRMGVSAIAIALVVGIGIGLFLRTSDPTQITLAGTETNTQTGVRLTVRIVGTAQGCTVDAEIDGLRPGSTYELHAVNRRGDTEVAVRWVAERSAQSIAGRSDIPVDDLAIVTLTQADGAILSTVRVGRPTAAGPILVRR